MVEELCEWAYTTGFRKILILNGHLPNIAPLQCAITNLCVAHPDFRLKALSGWDITADLQKQLHADSSYRFPHGDIVETSMMRYFRNDLVDMSKAIKIEKGKPMFFAYLLRKLSETGHLGDPTGSTVELGEKLYRMAVDGLAAQIEAALVEEPPNPRAPKGSTAGIRRDCQWTSRQCLRSRMPASGSVGSKHCGPSPCD